MVAPSLRISPGEGSARCQDSRLTTAAPDVEKVFPVLDRRGGQQPRPHPAQHPLAAHAAR